MGITVGQRLWTGVTMYVGLVIVMSFGGVAILCGVIVLFGWSAL